MTKKYVMLADTTRCINCRACVVACRAEWGTPLGHSRDWVREVEMEGPDGEPGLMLLPGRCQHCDDAPCVESCPSGAAYKRDDGVVLVDEDLCSGCELCVPACPYDARFLNPDTGTVSKCTFCQPRIDQGLAPACVQTCVGRALIFGDANDPDSEVSRLLREKQWLRLASDAVSPGPNHYYHTGGKALPAEVLPKAKRPQVQGRVLEEVVNPLAAAGILGMTGVFLAAGVKKLIDRRREVARNEDSHD
jgi:tetrathionate reductase subunit B